MIRIRPLASFFSDKQTFMHQESTITTSTNSRQVSIRKFEESVEKLPPFEAQSPNLPTFKRAQFEMIRS